MSKDTYASNLLGTLSTTIATIIDRQVADIGDLGISAATALVTIRNHPDDSIETLSHILQLTHSGVVRLVNRLEDDKLVKRYKRAQDARSVTIRLTIKGQKQAGEILKARASITLSVLETLSDTQQAALIPILEIALKNLTEDSNSARQICRLCDEDVCRPQGCPVEIEATNAK